MMRGAGGFLFVIFLFAVALFRTDDQPSIADSLRTIAYNYAHPLPTGKCR